MHWLQYICLLLKLNRIGTAVFSDTYLNQLRSHHLELSMDMINSNRCCNTNNNRIK